MPAFFSAAIFFSLELIAIDGPDAFYKGAIAKKIAAEMKANGGLVDMQALAAYEAAIREPVKGTYRGFDVVSMPPPSSGGINIIQMLNVLERFPVAELGPSECRQRSFVDGSGQACIRGQKRAPG